jgi:alpha-L-fucosidase
VLLSLLAAAALGLLPTAGAQPGTPAQPPDADPRLDWWRDARFGMFIHWGLYAVPAGEWEGKTGYGEWIMNHAQIPVEKYERFRARFNPQKFDAGAIVRAAKNAGVRYIVITTKHHDGFCLFDSKETDYDVMSTPFKRDIMKEMAAACRREGIKMCWYYSIMDWHHPDYTPRRDWEDRPADNADFDRYVKYMKAQLRELLTNYGPIGLLWFDGQWEGTWTDARGRDLYAYVRSLQPNIIVNNRVGKAGGDFGLNRDQGVIGDYGTPEQTIPDVAPEGDWETCMTMNDHWGYNQADKHFKSTEELIRNLADIASKGGNFLLNIGPTADGEIPPESIERLNEIGAWMKVNGESIHGTQRGPFPKLEWGRCTQKALPGKTRLYLHIFDWPRDGELVVPGLLNDPGGAHMLTVNGRKPVPVKRHDDSLVLTLPRTAPDPIDSVVVLETVGKADVAVAPRIEGPADIFVDSTEVWINTGRERVELRYTTDGSDPSPESPIAAGPVRLIRTSTVKARAFRDSKPVSPVAQMEFRQVQPREATKVEGAVEGLAYEYFEKQVKTCAEFDGATAAAIGTVPGFDLSPHKAEKNFGFRFRGYLRVPADGVYRLFTKSDDGSRLWVGDTLVVDNDKPHSLHEESGVIALAAGLHPITVAFFENSGGFGLTVSWSGPGLAKEEIPTSALVRKP